MRSQLYINTFSVEKAETMEYRKRQPEKLSAPHRLGRWLRLKQYQIEVTFGVYMFTPVEKFVFCK